MIERRRDEAMLNPSAHNGLGFRFQNLQINPKLQWKNLQNNVKKNLQIEMRVRKHIKQINKA